MSVTTKTVAPEATDSNDHAHCLLCGPLNPRSLNLSFHPTGDGTVEARFQGHAELQGYSHILHGGVIAALLDAAMTHCLFHRGIQAVTGDLHVRFVLPIPCDAELNIRAWISSAHPPLYHLDSEIVIDRKVMAWANAKFLQRRPQKQ
jgi:acyl-coenzyme A thioesterase PaaI-like protein